MTSNYPPLGAAPTPGRAPTPGWGSVPAAAAPPSSPSPEKKSRKKGWLISGGVAAGVLALLIVVGITAPDTTPSGGSPTVSTPAPVTVTVTRVPSSSPATNGTTGDRPASSTIATGFSASSATPTSTGSEPATTLEAPATVAMVTSAHDADTALRVLATIPVKGRATKTGYSRAQFGQAWTDDVTVEGGHNGCDTRNDILRRDLTDIAIKPGSNGCTVLTGVLHDPYTGTTIDFTRGSSTSSAVQIDHIVALGDAWQTGAQQLTVEQRQDLANDPMNLQATNGPTNTQKGDSDAASWLPPNKSYRCTYVARQIEVKATYHLWVTPAENDAMTRVLHGCGGTMTVGTAVASSTATTTTPTTAPVTKAAALAPTTTGVIAPPSQDDSDVYYKNCAAVRAAGKAPLYRGQPGYRAGLDRDDDGVACEN